MVVRIEVPQQAAEMLGTVMAAENFSGQPIDFINKEIWQLLLNRYHNAKRIVADREVQAALTALGVDANQPGGIYAAPSPLTVSVEAEAGA